MTPLEALSLAQASLTKGDVAGVLNHFSLPVAIEKNATHHVIETEAELTQAITMLLSDFVARGIRGARNKVVQNRVETDSAFLSIEVEHLDADGNVIDRSGASYLMHRDPSDTWRIIVMTIDLACDYTPGMCLLDDHAA